MWLRPSPAAQTLMHQKQHSLAPSYIPCGRANGGRAPPGKPQQPNSLVLHAAIAVFMLHTRL